MSMIKTPKRKRATQQDEPNALAETDPVPDALSETASQLQVPVSPVLPTGPPVLEANSSAIQPTQKSKKPRKVSAPSESAASTNFELGNPLENFVHGVSSGAPIVVAASIPVLAASAVPISALESAATDITSEPAKVREVPVKPPAKVFPPSVSFNELFDALVLYKDLYNSSLTVPEGWKVPPKSPWPRKTWSITLGDYIEKLREDIDELTAEEKAQLEGIGFLWKPISEKEKLVLLAFKAYRSKFGDLNLQARFRIPSDNADFPRATWGMKLGVVADGIRHRATYKSLHSELKAMGFVFDKLVEMHKHSFEDFFAALCLYRELHNGSLVTPIRWRVPSEAPWPEGAWGVNLCAKIMNIRSGAFKTTAEQRAQLDSIDFVWDTSELRNSRILLAFKAYSAKYSHLNVPQKFIVPENSEDFPAETWGMKLGKTVNGIRHRGNSKSLHEELRAMGFSF